MTVGPLDGFAETVHVESSSDASHPQKPSAPRRSASNSIHRLVDEMVVRFPCDFTNRFLRSAKTRCINSTDHERTSASDDIILCTATIFDMTCTKSELVIEYSSLNNTNIELLNCDRNYIMS